MLELLLRTLSDQKGTTNMTDYLLLLSPNEVASLYPMFLQSKYSFVIIKIEILFKIYICDRVIATYGKS